MTTQWYRLPYSDKFKVTMMVIGIKMAENCMVMDTIIGEDGA